MAHASVSIFTSLRLDLLGDASNKVHVDGAPCTLSTWHKDAVTLEQ